MKLNNAEMTILSARLGIKEISLQPFRHVNSRSSKLSDYYKQSVADFRYGIDCSTMIFHYPNVIKWLPPKWDLRVGCIQP